MKLRDLQRQLEIAVKADPKIAEANVVFGPEEGDHVQLKGGIIGKGANGFVLILAPIKLDNVGGF